MFHPPVFAKPRPTALKLPKTMLVAKVAPKNTNPRDQGALAPCDFALSQSCHSPFSTLRLVKGSL
jgi:hypothetical protein